jgi:FkbM family methyltransferase
MKDSSPVNLSRLFVVVVPLLLIVVVGLSIAVGNLSDLLETCQRRYAESRPKESAPRSRAAPTPPAGPPSPEVREPAVRVVDLGAEVDALGQFRWESTDTSKTYYGTDFGSVHMHLIGRGQSCPLHVHRRTAEATAIITGTPAVTHVFGHNGGKKTIQAVYAPGTIIASPPFSGHRWVNDSRDALQANLVFASPPFDGNLYLEPDDSRLDKGSAPEIFRPENSTELLSAQAEPVHQRKFGFMQDKMSLVTVEGQGVLGPFPGVAIFYVSRGRGTVTADTTEAIERNYLFSVFQDTRVTVKADDDAPLTMLLFRPQNDGIGDILKRGRKKYSQNNEELVIREFFKDRKNGVFLDVGAGHYKRDSTTFYLEEQLGWKGVAVDALGQYAADYEKHRPGTRFESYLVTDKSRGAQKFYHATAYNEVSSVSRDVASHQAAQYRGDGTVEELEVPTITLTELLDQLGVEHLDFLSMDIEEHEPQALRGFDIDRFKPELVCVEAHLAVRRQLSEYFSAHGYVRLHEYAPYDPFNWYFTPSPRDA